MARFRPSAKHPPAPRHIRLGARDIFSEGLSNQVLQDLYHHFMTVSWTRLFATIIAFFLVFDLIFGCLYNAVPGCIANLNPPGFLGAFFFSVETLATVGYGDMHPQSLYGHVVAMGEIFVGVLMLAVITGIMFARFSRPRARFMFAKLAVVRPLDGKLTLMFRAANARQNVVQEASAVLRMLRDEVTPEGYRIRRIVDLPLLRSRHPVFSLGWTLMHAIDEASPLRLESAETLAATQTIFIVSLSGTDETTGQMLMARAEYASEAIRWNQAFRDILETQPDGSLHIDYGKFDEVEPLPDAGESRS
ncbi:MAG TPA: ion channel [Steroidobacteraceae bacterium]|jgi:inward rectifier potassium channel|nr:ion channel [Steroidobacteraceae bacterium]